PADLLLDRVSGELRWVEAGAAAAVARHELHDVALPRRNSEDLAAAAPDHDGRTGALHGRGHPLQVVDRVVRTVEGERFVTEEALEDDRGFFEPFDPDRRGLEPDAGVFVLLSQPAGAEPDLQPARR